MRCRRGRLRCRSAVFFALALGGLGLGLPTAARAQDAPSPLPVSMIIQGTLGPSSDGKVTPAVGDTVTAVVAASGQGAGSSTVLNSGGYALILSQPDSFQGTQLALRLTHAGVTYKLLNTAGAEARLAFNGAFLPGRTTMNLVASSQVVNGGGGGGGGGDGGDGGGTPPPAVLPGDLNGDGKVDEQDLLLLKRALSGAAPINARTMDINGDGVTNTRDLIDLIRFVRNQARTGLTPVSRIPQR